jgi:hypothetical protein
MPKQKQMKTNRQIVLEVLGLPQDSQLSVPMLAKLTDLPLEALQKVYQRGLGAAKSNWRSIRLKSDFSKDPSAPRSARLSSPQWAMARVYSFIAKGKTFYTADADIARDYKLG